VFVWVFPKGGAVVWVGVVDGFCVVFGPAIRAICMMPPNLFNAHWYRMGSHLRNSLSRASWLGGTLVLLLVTSNPAAAWRKLRM